ncbi:MAG: hypothetical protein WKG07_24235, partial [Hymenobacter sp.]
VTYCFGEVSIHGLATAQVRELMQRKRARRRPKWKPWMKAPLRLSYEKSMIDLCFEEGQLQFVNFGVFINDDLEVQWPK